MFKRILLFVLTNIAVILVITIIFAILEYIFGFSIASLLWSYTWLFIFAAIIGFWWSFISLLISRWIAKTFHKITLIDSSELHKFDRKIVFVYQKIEEIANQNNIKMPQVWIYKSSDPNAFATWPSKNKSLVAVSSGLLENMDENEIEWVLAHEMSHILNWDMITMTLLQWVVNTFVIFISRLIMIAIENTMDENFGFFGYIIIVSLLEWALMFLALPLIMWFSRYREYRADAGSANLVWSHKMIASLEKLKSFVGQQKKEKDSNFAAFKISSKGSWMKLFSSHPDLDDRIKKLKENY